MNSRKVPGREEERRKNVQNNGGWQTPLFQLMEEPIPYSPDYELHFYTKFSNFDMISRELQFLILHQYKDYLRFEIRHEEERVENVSKDEMMPDAERHYNLIWFRHRLDKLRFDEEWVLQLINNLRMEGIER